MVSRVRAFGGGKEGGGGGGEDTPTKGGSQGQGGQTMYYESCPKCRKKVQQARCESCQQTVTPTYRSVDCPAAGQAAPLPPSPPLPCVGTCSAQ